jgi:hypothetical protein
VRRVALVAILVSGVAGSCQGHVEGGTGLDSPLRPEATTFAASIDHVRVRLEGPLASFPDTRGSSAALRPWSDGRSRLFEIRGGDAFPLDERFQADAALRLDADLIFGFSFAGSACGIEWISFPRCPGCQNIGPPFRTTCGGFDATGQERWRHVIPGYIDDISAAPSFSSDGLRGLVVLNGTANTLQEIDCHGQQLWQRAIPDNGETRQAVATCASLPGWVAYGSVELAKNDQVVARAAVPVSGWQNALALLADANGEPAVVAPAFAAAAHGSDNTAPSAVGMRNARLDPVWTFSIDEWPRSIVVIEREGVVRWIVVASPAGEVFFLDRDGGLHGRQTVCASAGPFDCLDRADVGRLGETEILMVSSGAASQLYRIVEDGE